MVSEEDACQCALSVPSVCVYGPAPEAVDFLPSASLELWKLPSGVKMTSHIQADWAKLRVDTEVQILENQHNPNYFLKTILY